MRTPPQVVLRSVLLLVGAFAGTLLVRALDAGFAGAPRPLTVVHGVFGILTAAVAMPGPVLAFFVFPESSERARGLAVGGSVVTALAALLGGALCWSRRSAEGSAGDAAFVVLLWAAGALPTAVIDVLRLRGGSGPGDGRVPPR